MSKEKRERILGIDLGTTNSAAAILEAGRPVVAADLFGDEEEYYEEEQMQILRI